MVDHHQVLIRRLSNDLVILIMELVAVDTKQELSNQDHSTIELQNLKKRDL